MLTETLLLKEIDCRSLCARYPRKHSVMLSFLSQMLRDDGGYEYKKAIVDTIMLIVDENAEAKVKRAV